MIKMGKSFLYVISISLLVFACGKKTDIRRSEIIDDDIFMELLFDIHLTDGIVSASKSSAKYKKDSTSIYNYVFKKHNVRRIDFEKTVKYYSLNSEEFYFFYDSLISYFTYLENELKEEMKIEKIKETEERKRQFDSLNLWKLKTEWNLPEDGEKNPIPFNIPLIEHGTYKLSANIRLFEDDESINQRMTLIANYSDGTKDLNSAGSMIKDGEFEMYEVRITTDTLKSLNSLSGWVLDHSKGTGKKHANVKDIRLINEHIN
jgi:hypothetical protein